MGVAVDRTPDVDLNEEPCKLNRGRHMGRRGPEFPSLSLALSLSFHMFVCISSIMKSPHLSKDQPAALCPWGQFLSNRIKTNRQLATVM
ncbi:hypothetical protein QQF64_007214 [Cirrhinus molitorella]|uniref:Uncharacterized protein n=1 Tax=Cirrhinus molitorella TaxID=172907 RepID=A0ABR3MA08_9TELE